MHEISWHRSGTGGNWFDHLSFPFNLHTENRLFLQDFQSVGRRFDPAEAHNGYQYQISAPYLNREHDLKSDLNVPLPVILNLDALYVNLIYALIYSCPSIKIFKMVDWYG